MDKRKNDEKKGPKEANEPNFDRHVTYSANVTVRNKMVLISEIKEKLKGTPRLDLLRRTCFGSWLNLKLDRTEGALIHYILQMQVPVREPHDPLLHSLIYEVGGFRVKFGPKEFCLITGFRFGEQNWKPLKPKVLPFRERVFSHVKKGNITLEELSMVFNGSQFNELTHEDAVRVCLLMMLHYIFLGYGGDKGYVVDAYWLELVESMEEWNSYPWGTDIWMHTHMKLKDVIPKNRNKHLKTPKGKKVSYTLGGFIWPFQIWIFEAFPVSLDFFIKDEGFLPRGVQWIPNLSFGPNQHCYFHGPFAVKHFPRETLEPTKAEKVTDWWLCSMESFGLVNHRPPRRRCNKPPLLHPLDQPMHNLPPPSVDGPVDVHVDVPALMSPLMLQEFYFQLVFARTLSLEQQLFKTQLEVSALKNQVGQHSVGQHSADKLPADFDLNNIEVTDEENPDKSTTPFVSSTPTNTLEDISYDANDVVLPGKRVRKAGPYLMSPYGPLQSSTPVAKVDKKKKRTVVSLEKLTLPSINEGAQQSTIDIEDDPEPYSKKGKEEEVLPTPRNLRPWNEDFVRKYGSQTHPVADYEFLCWLMSEASVSVSVCIRTKQIVNKKFWYTLLCRQCPLPYRQPNENIDEGWLEDAHIRLWVDYLNTIRPPDADWCAIDPLFCTCIEKGFDLATYYSDGHVFPGKWKDVRRVFIPACSDKHWVLLVFDIELGIFTYYDSLILVDDPGRGRFGTLWTGLEAKIRTSLPDFLEVSGVFDRLGLNKGSYTISFRSHPQKETAQQRSMFGDCGVFVCMFMYRLAFNMPVNTSLDTVEVALWYRESLLSLFYEFVDL
ncbi:uncharacterized protein [Rutidosis leptorrhynchoides]|uniref:uncharacterized protein n=1 Tax=Rutidosis leptorrhynchoides TaxID=125765 RepID=UPI003A99C3BE